MVDKRVRNPKIKKMENTSSIVIMHSNVVSELIPNMLGKYCAKKS